MSSNSVCNHTRDKKIGLPLRGRWILLIARLIIDRPNWTLLGPTTIINEGFKPLGVITQAENR